MAHAAPHDAPDRPDVEERAAPPPGGVTLVEARSSAASGADPLSLPGAVPVPEGWARLARFGLMPMLLALDALALGIGVLGWEWIGREIDSDSPSRKTAFFALVFLACLWHAGMYRSRLVLSVLNDLPTLVGRWLVAAAVAVLAQVVWSNAMWKDYIVNWRFLWGAITGGVLVVVFRAVGYAWVRAMRSRRLVVHRTVIVGAGRVGHQVADILLARPEYGLHPVGFLDSDPRFVADTTELPVLGGPGVLSEVLRRGQVHNVVVAFSSMPESELVHVIRTCDRARCDVFIVPRLFEVHHVQGDMDTAWGLPLVRLRRATYRTGAWRAKRLFDVVFAATALFLLAPLMGAVALAVRFDGGGKQVLFRQQRVGVDGHTFHLLKFRSLAASAAEAATTWNVANDQRMSRVGRLIRKTSVDELPQLINILRGDMSVVGPRPERPHFVNEFRSVYPSYEARHRVPSGLTGWAQVNGLRGDTSIADRARFDNYYIENWSLWLDLKIILRTFGSVVRGAGA